MKFGLKLLKGSLDTVLRHPGTKLAGKIDEGVSPHGSPVAPGISGDAVETRCFARDDHFQLKATIEDRDSINGKAPGNLNRCPIVPFFHVRV